MNHAQLNILVTEYQLSKDDNVFSEIHRQCSEVIATMQRKYSSTYKVDSIELESMLNEKLFLITLTYDIEKGDFIKMLTNALRSGCIDITRLHIKRSKAEKTPGTFLIEDEEVDVLESGVITELTANAEDEFTESWQKKNDQRQLIESLLEKADDKCRQAFIALSESGSYLAAAKQLKVSDKTVKRRIRKLADNLDANLNYNDYFTVCTEPA